MDIHDLNFTTRTYNCLKRAGIDTVEELLHYDITDLIRIRNMGKKSLDEIMTKLKEVDRNELET